MSKSAKVVLGRALIKNAARPMSAFLSKAGERTTAYAVAAAIMMMVARHFTGSRRRCQSTP